MPSSVGHVVETDATISPSSLLRPSAQRIFPMISQLGAVPAPFWHPALEKVTP